MPDKRTIILLAHGSSDAKWCTTFEKLAAPTLSAIPDSVVAYMELSQPSLAEVVADRSAKGCSDFVVLPLFLAAGRHLRRDVPAMIAALEEEHRVSIQLAPPIGESPQLGDAIRSVVEDTLETSHG
ncbi:sirohydrochlorin chelatase [Marinobacter xestospongiae]|uniref:sirohydrochlorin chelatase n=1 Tax=Marinobacter xestospongiae TaxID=994319 RepID=UPI002934BE15|nr:CbiX/SirB N-terminal domain-containing protein [Marinobacter xestospongiae]MCG8519752.1 CbiX/SirB N-terminal domain-containing protein [Pseudomonadales bacterium]